MHKHTHARTFYPAKTRTFARMSASSLSAHTDTPALILLSAWLRGLVCFCRSILENHTLARAHSAHERVHAGSDACTPLSDMNSWHAFVCMRRCACLRLRSFASRQTPSLARRSSRSRRRRYAAYVAEEPGIDAVKRREESGRVLVCVWKGGGGLECARENGRGRRLLGAGTSKTSRHLQPSTLDAFPFHHDSPYPPSLPPRQTQQTYPLSTTTARCSPQFLERLTPGPGSSRWPTCLAR
jgi:hypothetical protein